MSDAASFDAIMQYNLLEVFCEALNAAIFVTDKLDELSFASVRLMHQFPVSESAIATGTRARDLYGALYDAGCRFGTSGSHKDKNREDWIAERVASAWKERVDTIEPSGPDRWFRIVSRRFSSGLGFTVIQDVSEHKKKEILWRTERERVRMTEEILDTLPLAVAIKDRNLNFAAVNQQFCRMMSTTPEGILGRGIWDIFDATLAGSLEEADWHLLATGADRECVVKVDRPDAEPASFLHRAKRIGKPGSHYLSMTFDQLPVENVAMVVPPALTLAAGGAGGVSASQGNGHSLIAAERNVERLHKVAYVNTTASGATIIAQAAMRGIELCIIRSENEFSAFLPAVKAAGVTIDLVMIEPNADFAFATLSVKHGIRHRTLSPGADVLESIVDAFERPSRPRLQPEKISLPETPSQTVSATDSKPMDIDILAVEDNPVNRLVIEQILESLGLNFVVVTNGGEAMARIAELRPQMMLVDVTLPDMEIDAFMPAIEPLFRESGIQPPVIGLIAKDSADQRQMCKQAGLIDAIAKPLSPEAVDRILRKHLFHEPVQSSSSTKSAA